MKNMKKKILLLLIIHLLCNKLDGATNRAWRTNVAALGLTFVNYKFLNKVFVPVLIKTTGLLSPETVLNPDVAFSIGSCFTLLISPTLGGLIENSGLLTKKEFEEAQKKAVGLSLFYYFTPTSFKDKTFTTANRILHFIKGRLFSPSRNGISVKSYDTYEKIIPTIRKINDNLTDDFQKILKFNVLNISEQKPFEGQAQAATFENNSEYTKIVFEFCKKLIDRENARSQLYINYDSIEYLNNLKKHAERIVNNINTMTDTEKKKRLIDGLITAYTTTEGGILGLVGEGIKSFEQ